MARLGGFFCPYVITEGTPMGVIGLSMFAVSIVTALLSWNLPETAGKALGEVNAETDPTTKKNQTDGQAPYLML